MKKLRGNKKRIKQIENWRLNNLEIDIDYLKKYHKDYVKFRIFPWNPIAMSFHNFPSPKKKIRKQIFEALIDIYNNWDKQLKELNEPYYLKIWLFEPNIYESQIVCAINEKIEYYDNIFKKSDSNKVISESTYSNISKRIKDYNWDIFENEVLFFGSDFQKENFNSEDDYNSEINWLKNKLKKPHSIKEIDRFGQIEKVYIFKDSDVWLGNK